MKLSVVIDELQKLLASEGDMEMFIELSDEDALTDVNFTIERSFQQNLRIPTPGCRCGSCYDYIPVEVPWMEVW